MVELVGMWEHLNDVDAPPLTLNAGGTWPHGTWKVEEDTFTLALPDKVLVSEMALLPPSPGQPLWWLLLTRDGRTDAFVRHVAPCPQDGPSPSLKTLEAF